jgi:Flp pilus assembly protein TadG
MGTVLFLLVIQICFIAAALSVDIAHQISMRAELQAASDAAAMAGEEVLLSQATSNSTAAQAAAQLVWNANYCDGKLLSANNAVMSTTIGQTGGTPSLLTLKVSANVRAVNLFGMLLGHDTDTLNITRPLDLVQ